MDRIKLAHDAGGGSSGSLVKGIVENGVFNGTVCIGGGSHISGDKSISGETFPEEKLAGLIRTQTSFWKIFGNSSLEFANKWGIEGEFIPWIFRHREEGVERG